MKRKEIKLVGMVTLCVLIVLCGRMLVEVNKHTEGSKEKKLRPNGLPESLIRYDGTVYWMDLLPLQFLLS